MQHIFLLSFIACICALASFASDINAPSIFNIANELSVSINFIQFSMTVFMLGLSCSQLFYGPWSDSIGRKKPLILGVVLFSVGSLLAAIADSGNMLVAARLIQGLGAGSAACIWRAIFLDNFPHDEIPIYGSYLQLLLLFILPTEPLVGGAFDAYFSWRASFYFMFLYGCTGLVLLIFIPDRPLAKVLPMSLGSIAQRYALMLRNHDFLRYSFCASAGFGVYFSWFIVGPVLTKLSPHDFGIINFLVSLPATFIASQINKRLSKAMGTQLLLRTGFCCILFSSLFVQISHWLENSMILFITFFFATLGTMVALPHAFSCAFKPFTDSTGSASGLYCFVLQLGAVLMGSALSYLPDETAHHYAMIIVLVSLSALRVLYTSPPNELSS